MEYYTAYICCKRHVLSIWKPYSHKTCKFCGSEVFSRCPNCGSPIEGDSKDTSIHNISTYKMPYYCGDCGNPYPWTRLIIDQAVELLSLDEELDDETKAIVKDAIPDLITEPSVCTPLAEAKYKKYVSKGSKLLQDSLRQLLIDIVSESVRRSLFG